MVSAGLLGDRRGVMEDIVHYMYCGECVGDKGR